MMQNMNEYKILSEFANRYSCFPKAIRMMHDYSVIEVEQCKMADAHKLFYDIVDDKAIHDIVIDDSNYLNRIDPFSYVPLNMEFNRWFAFAFRTILDLVLEQFSAKTIDDVLISLNAIEQYQSSLSDKYCQYARSGHIFLTRLIENENKSAKSLLDLIKFHIEYGYSRGFELADLWNVEQWGLSSDGRLMVVDVGYSKSLSCSKYYRRISIDHNIKPAEPGSSPYTFNGYLLSQIRSPFGNPIKCKFYTKSEYILSVDNMSRHIKHANLSDDGLWDWSDKLVFVEKDNLFKFIDEMNAMNFLHAKKIEFTDDYLTVSQLDENGNWKIGAFLPYQTEPNIGMHICEFYIDQFTGKSGILKNYHPGHDVTYIEEKDELRNVS